MKKYEEVYGSTVTVRQDKVEIECLEEGVKFGYELGFDFDEIRDLPLLMKQQIIFKMAVREFRDFALEVTKGSLKSEFQKYTPVIREVTKFPMLCIINEGLSNFGLQTNISLRIKRILLYDDSGIQLVLTNGEHIREGDTWEISEEGGYEVNIQEWLYTQTFRLISQFDEEIRDTIMDKLVRGEISLYIEE